MQVMALLSNQDGRWKIWRLPEIRSGLRFFLLFPFIAQGEEALRWTR